MPKALSLIRWPGSKRRLAKRLIQLFPEHRSYVEPFGGSLAVFFAKEPSNLEVINDLNRELVGLYRCAKWHPDALAAEIGLSLQSRADLRDLRENRGLTDLQRAARFFLANYMSFGAGGIDGSFAVSKTNPPVSRANMLERIHAASSRLDRVLIECLDWQRLVSIYDSPETLFFFDPPYLNAPTGMYEGWNEQQMLDLAETLPTIHGKWILTTDGSDFCRDLFSPYLIESVETSNGLANNRTRPSTYFTELIIRPVG